MLIPKALSNVKWKNFLNPSITLLIIILWVGLSGIGGYGFQNHPDWVKHNAVLKGLVIYPWPVSYNTQDPLIGTATLVYYLGFYLPAALVGKFLGWNAANHTLFLWAIFGTTLSIFWFQRLSKQKSIFIVLLFIMFGGMDIVGYLLNTKNHVIIDPTTHLQWWAKIWQYSSNTTLLYWVPQHTISAWILTALILDQAINKRTSSNSLFFLCAGVLHTPLATLGLLPYVVANCYDTRLKGFLSFQNLVTAPVILSVVVLFYKSVENKGQYPQGWIWNLYNWPEFFPQLIIFYLLEFLLYYLLIIYNHAKILGQLRLYLYVSLFCLIILPWYKLGLGNDIVMRGSIPSLYVLGICIASFLSSNISLIRKFILVILLMIGAVTASAEIARSLVNFNMKQCPINRVVDVTELQPYQVRLQFLGNPSSLFFQLLSPLDLTSPNRNFDKLKPYEYKPSSCYYRYLEQNK